MVASTTLFVNIEYTNSAYLRNSLPADDCFHDHLDNCESCIIATYDKTSTTSGRCGYCHSGSNGGKCASVYGDADMPGFHCDDWTKPNHANSGPTTCKRSHSTTVDHTAKIVEQKVELRNWKLLVDHPQSIPDQPVTDGKRVPAVKLLTEPERQPKVQKETKNETKKIVKKGTPKTVSTPNNKKTTYATGPPAMSPPEIKNLLKDTIDDLGVNSGIMKHERIEWDKAHEKEERAKEDSRNIDWEGIKRNMKGNQEIRTELHYLQKKENEGVTERLKIKTIADNTLKSRIANRDISMTEHGAVNHPVNTEEILDKTTRPDHLQFNKYLKAKDKEFNGIVGSTNYARVHSEHSRYAANEVDDADTTPIGMTKSQLQEESNKYNDMEGHLSPGSYKQSIDPNEHNIGQKGWW